VTGERRPSRRLAAILHADAADFTATMRADEEAAQAAISRAMALARATADAWRGRVVGTAGDAFLAEFASVVDAFAAAVAFQKAWATARTGGTSPPLAFRIGVHLGEVIVEGDDIFGDGVNLAARVQAQAPPDGVSITAAVRQQLGTRSDIAFDDAGLRPLRGAGEPVRIFAAYPPFDPASRRRRLPRLKGRKLLPLASGALVLALSAGTLAVIFGTFNPPAAPDEVIASAFEEPRPVVAVLPFDDPTAGADAGYFADGVTQDVIAHLGRFSELLVLSWNAVAPFRDGVADLAAIRRDTGARYVLHGSIRRGDGRLRIAVQLTEAADGVLVWSRRYDAGMDDVFRLQDRIAGAVAGALAVGVAKIEETRAIAQPTDALDAYELVLRGRAHARPVDRESNLKARAAFTRAIDADPDYADAHAGLAWTHLADIWWGWTEWPRVALETAHARADRALALDPRNVQALNVRAELQFMDRRLVAARQSCSKAVEINPNAAGALATCGGVMVFTGDLASGIEQLEASLRLDPHPSSWVFANLGAAYFLVGRYGDAADLLGAGGFHEDPAPYAVLAAVYARLGRPRAAADAVERTRRLFPFFDAATFANNLAGAEHAADLLAGLKEAGFE